MEVNVKVTIEAGKSLFDLIGSLVGKQQPLEVKEDVVAPSKAKKEIIQEAVIEEKNDGVTLPDVAEKAKFVITLQILRALCSVKRNEGADISEVFKKYGAEKLSGLDEKDYAAVYAEIEKL